MPVTGRNQSRHCSARSRSPVPVVRRSNCMRLGAGHLPFVFASKRPFSDTRRSDLTALSQRLARVSSDPFKGANCSAVPARPVAPAIGATHRVHGADTLQRPEPQQHRLRAVGCTRPSDGPSRAMSWPPTPSSAYDDRPLDPAVAASRPPVPVPVSGRSRSAVRGSPCRPCRAGTAARRRRATFGASRTRRPRRRSDHRQRSAAAQRRSAGHRAA